VPAVIYPDRVITIQGTVDNMVAAQAAISLKLAEYMDKDMHNANGVSMVLFVTVEFKSYILCHLLL